MYKRQTLVATPAAGSVFGGFEGCDRVSGARCTVRMQRSRTVVATFSAAPRVELRVPPRLVFHAPYDAATVTAHAASGGGPVRGVAVRTTFACPGMPAVTRRSRTDAAGNVSFTEAREMVNAVRILSCTVTAAATIAGHTVVARASVRFIHPYWLKVVSQEPGGSEPVISAFGRPGSLLDVRVNGRVVERARIGATGWVNVPLPRARPGDVVDLKGVAGRHYSHAITVGKTPASQVVHGH